MSDRLLVEVQGENGAYYKAFVTDVLEDEIMLAFEKSWQPESRFPFNRVRLPPSSSTQPVYEQEQEVEVSRVKSDVCSDGVIMRSPGTGTENGEISKRELYCEFCE